jgi:hypothetical protein
MRLSDRERMEQARRKATPCATGLFAQQNASRLASSQARRLAVTGHADACRQQQRIFSSALPPAEEAAAEMWAWGRGQRRCSAALVLAPDLGQVLTSVQTD